jgi:hypothetical protein
MVVQKNVGALECLEVEVTIEKRADITHPPLAWHGVAREAGVAYRQIPLRRSRLATAVSIRKALRGFVVAKDTSC